MLLASCGQDSMIRLWRLSQRSEDSGTATFTIRDLPADQDIQMKERTFSYQSQGKGSGDWSFCYLPVSAGLQCVVSVWMCCEVSFSTAYKHNTVSQCAMVMGMQCWLGVYWCCCSMLCVAEWIFFPVFHFMHVCLAKSVDDVFKSVWNDDCLTLRSKEKKLFLTINCCECVVDFQ